MKFTEAKLEQAVIELFKAKGEEKFNKMIEETTKGNG